jgi:phospholipid/cholesterol/gamma-HCH transport system substrate-binding protein
MSISPSVKLSVDTKAAIASSGMLGDKYVMLLPGNDKTLIEAGGTIAHTKDFRSLEDQVGEIIFLATGGSAKGGGATPQ